ncbi:uncharacterized protein METZ01_LOCUS487615 [marine metagenome]|uniref:Uncharacterized protein n=1 Tax=marine metagenome TaxID=408172 RepID=A0A383CRK1_9ZZZZ
MAELTIYFLSFSQTSNSNFTFSKCSIVCFTTLTNFTISLVFGKIHCVPSLSYSNSNQFSKSMSVAGSPVCSNFKAKFPYSS